MYENRYNWTWSQVFEEGARKPLGAKERTNKKLNPHMESTPYIYLGNCQILVCGIFSNSHLTISPLVASWLVAIGLLGSDMIWWGDDRIHRSLQQSVGHLRVCWGLKRSFVQLHYGAVIETLTFILLAVKKLHKKRDQNSSPQTVQLPVSQWYGHFRVLGIPIPKTLMIYSSPVVLTLASRR